MGGGGAELDADCSPNRLGGGWGAASCCVASGSGSLISSGGEGFGVVGVWWRVLLTSSR